MYFFTNMLITLAPEGSPDMILTAFDVKFQRKKMRYPPGPVDPQKSSKKTKKMHLEMIPPPARPPERGVRGAAAPREEKKARSDR